MAINQHDPLIQLMATSQLHLPDLKAGCFLDKIEFLCTTKKTGVQPYNVWCYIGCSKCSKKLLCEISSFTCMFCEKTDAEGCLRYRVELSLSYHANIVSGQVTARDSAPVFKNNGQIN
ncbi:unnamed protein product [Brassica oleracea var. botrytis]